MLIITSAAYIPPDLVADIGLVPPVFLPLRNKPLYELQLALFQGLSEKIFLSLPAGFELAEGDLNFIERNSIKIVRSSANLSLAESLIEILDEVGVAVNEPLKILHGDTLLERVPWQVSDVFCVSTNEGYYLRSHARIVDGRLGGVEYRYCSPGEMVLSGYFSFSCGKRFLCHLKRLGDFILSLNAYISERKVAVEDVAWLDCGHVNAYYRSRAKMTGERAFNRLEIKNHFIRKRSQNEHKLAAEVFWFGSMPPEMRHYFPQLGKYSLTEGDTFYDLEYIYCLPLSDLFSYGRLEIQEWEVILRRCREFCLDCRSFTPSVPHSSDPAEMFRGKTMVRLERFADQHDWDLTHSVAIDGKHFPSLLELAISTAEIIEMQPNRPTMLIHGDFCFSNILYDVRSHRIKVIDPRGLDSDDKFSIMGDPLYDLAKLAHSVIGGYDAVISGILSGRRSGASNIFTLGSIPDRLLLLGDRFESIFFAEIEACGGPRVVAAATVQLFLSMLPLHSESAKRQYAFIARAFALADRFNLWSKS